MLYKDHPTRQRGGGPLEILRREILRGFMIQFPSGMNVVAFISFLSLSCPGLVSPSVILLPHFTTMKWSGKKLRFQFGGSVNIYKTQSWLSHWQYNLKIEIKLNLS